MYTLEYGRNTQQIYVVCAFAAGTWLRKTANVLVAADFIVRCCGRTATLACVALDQCEPVGFVSSILQVFSVSKRTVSMVDST